VVLESTTYPGTTDELLKGILESGGLRSGRDFFLAFSPEREDPGNKGFSTASIPKIVGGVDRDATEVAAALYARALDRVVTVRSARVAEATKLTENIFRSVNIALVNELKVVYDRMGIDVWDVLDAAATKPFGFMKFTPGPGLGGHCIPLDPFYLTWKAREYGISTRFIELAGEVNVAMPRYVIDKLQEGLNAQGKPLKGARVLVLGLAYKKDIDDPRESPSFELIELLRQRGAEVSYHDPHIPVAPPMRSWPDLPRLESQPLTPERLAAVDAVLVATDHTAVDYAMVADSTRLIVDTRGVYREPRPNIIKA
jgi:UDP-N-acetyl-D-glucosamine dehydrogenase